MTGPAFEDRIRRVVAWPPVYDLTKATNRFSEMLARGLMKMRWVMSPLISLQMSWSEATNFYMKHAMSTAGRETPYDAATWMMEMNEGHLHSDRIEQDVLLRAGENDAFQPPKLMELQEAALTNARSVTIRLFTEDEDADQHCQVGNIGLALEAVVDWLDETDPDGEGSDRPDGEP